MNSRKFAVAISPVRVGALGHRGVVKPQKMAAWQMQFGPVGVWGAQAFRPPQAESDRDARPAIRTAPQKHHDVQPVDLALLGERVGPPCPRQPLCESFLAHHVVELEVAALVARFGLGDQDPHQHPGRKGHYPQEPVERIVAATGQKPSDACL